MFRVVWLKNRERSSAHGKPGEGKKVAFTFRRRKDVINIIMVLNLIQQYHLCFKLLSQSLRPVCNLPQSLAIWISLQSWTPPQLWPVRILAQPGPICAQTLLPSSRQVHRMRPWNLSVLEQQRHLKPVLHWRYP